MVPEQVAEGLLVQLGNPDAFGVGWDVLCDDVHRQLAEVEVAADAGRGGDAGGVVDLSDDGFGQLPGGQMVVLEISRYVHKNLVDRIDMDILRRDVFQVDRVDFGRRLHIIGHPGRDNQVGNLPGGVLLQSPGVKGGCPQGRFPVFHHGRMIADGRLQTRFVGLFDLLDHLEQPRPPGDAVGLQRRGDRQADGLFGPGGVGHHQVGGQRVELPGDAFGGGVIGFQVDGEIGLHRWTNHLPKRLVKKGSVRSKKRCFSCPRTRTV